MNPHIKPITIGGVYIKNNVFLAPLAGYTDSAFRRICKRYGAGLAFSEMVSIDALYFGSQKTMDILAFKNEEHPIGVQLFGGHPERVEKALRKIEGTAFDFIDFNAGCPVKKVIKSRAGSYLLTDLPLLREMLTAIKENTDKPLTLKTRIGWDSGTINVEKVLEMAQKIGVSMLTVHTRTRAEGFKSECHIDILSRLKKQSSIPIVGNGGIKDFKSANRYFDEAAADAVMVGRAAFEKPWIFKEIIENRDFEADIDERVDLMLEQINDMRKERGDITTANEIKKFLAHYSKGMPRAAEFRKSIFASSDIDNIMQNISTFKKVCK